VAAAPGLKIYVANVATQPGETAGYDLADHVEAILAHTAPGLIDLVLANDRFDAQVPAGWLAESVRLRWPPVGEGLPRLVTEAVVDPANAHRHDPARLATAILRLADREHAFRRGTGVARTA
ncbi:MAG: protein of unknown function and CofD, partial [Chloroflexi bacterium]|nr:protein of unknown function and CofD [Chloroflexota bacterium]